MKNMKRMASIILLMLTIVANGMAKSSQLAFRTKGEQREMILLDGTVLRYTAYYNVSYVTNVEDSIFQVLNFFVPEGATQRSPILLRTYVADNQSSMAQTPSAFDATGRALQEGMCVCIPGARGGTPCALLDMKAAVRYLRFNDKCMQGSAERIIVDGTGVGGALSALLGLTANHPDYESQLSRMGAAKAKDNVYASVCYAPAFDCEQTDASMDNVQSWLVASANRFLAEGGSIHDSLGFEYVMYYPPTPAYRPGGPRYMRAKPIRTDIVGSVDMEKYQAYVTSRQVRMPEKVTLSLMPYISAPKAQTAQHWYIRHGALDYSASFLAPVSLATKLMNEGRDVDFSLPWNRRREGDYNLDDLFRWIRSIL